MEVKRRSTYRAVLIPCVVCRREFPVRPCEIKKGKRICSMQCRSVAYRGSGNPRWKGGRIEDGHGRQMVYSPGDPHATMMGGKYAYEYRLVAAKKIGRALLNTEIVHHVNGDNTDNRPENLEVMTQSEHAYRHDLPNSRRRA